MKKEKNNMEDILILLSAYGMTFGLQHKIPYLHGKNEKLDKLLQCTYCTGFHAGYLAYGLKKGLDYAQTGQTDATLGEALTFAFASSSFSYIADTGARMMESNADPIIVEDEIEEESEEIDDNVEESNETS